MVTKVGLSILHNGKDKMYDIESMIKKLNEKFDCERYTESNFDKYDIIVIDNLNKLYMKFINCSSSNQKLLIIPTSFSFDYVDSKHCSNNVNERIFAGVLNPHLKIVKLQDIGSRYFTNKIKFPFLKFDMEQNILSKENFFSKYNIDPNLKIITFLDQRLERLWKDYNLSKHREQLRARWVTTNKIFLQNFKKIHDSLLKIGYKLVTKIYMGCVSQEEFESSSYYKFYENMTLISNEYLKEMYSYSEMFFISSNTSLVHVPYLFNKKSLHITDKKDNWINLRTWFAYKSIDSSITFDTVKCGPIVYIDDFVRDLNNINNYIKKVNDFDVSHLKEKNQIYENIYYMTKDEYNEILLKTLNEINNNSINKL